MAKQQKRRKGAMGLRTHEAAKLLGVSVGTVRLWADAGKLPHFRTPGNQRRFNHHELEQFLAELTGGKD